MLKSIDILIGFLVIMLMVSTSVTLITQWILTISRMRGKKLLIGIQALLRQIDPELLTPEYAEQIARRVLTHPMAGRGGSKLAEVIQREDLIKIVMDVAASAAGVPAAAAATATGTTIVTGSAKPPDAAEQALVEALRKAGIPHPAQTLDAVRMASMKLEAVRPDLAAHVREATAIITAAESQFVANVNSWFDQTMESVSHSYANHSRVWTVAISTVLAFGIQLDAFKLVNRLSMDDSFRSSLVKQAQTAQSEAGQVQALSEGTKENLAQLQILATEQLITWPSSSAAWRTGWEHSSFFGMLLAAVLLSMGAPFWFNALGDLLNLRPALAAKEDAQRADRLVSQQPRPHAAG